MPTLEYDLRYISACKELLKDYLLSKDIYRPIGISAGRGLPPYPQLTLGNMLLAIMRAQARRDKPEVENDLRRLERQINRLHKQWRVAWETKARDEFRARLRLWGNYLDDYRKDPGLHASRYGYEVGRRVLLQILESETVDIPQEQLSLLAGMDKLLQAFFSEGAFAWDEELTSSFPREPYWYLYGYLREELL